MPTTHTIQTNRNSEAAIWARLFTRDKPRLSAAAARSLLELEFPPEDRQRMHELSARARAGTLSPEEQQEAENYGLIGSLLSILKSKARQTLKARSGANGARLR